MRRGTVVPAALLLALALGGPSALALAAQPSRAPIVLAEGEASPEGDERAPHQQAAPDDEAAAAEHGEAGEGEAPPLDVKKLLLQFLNFAVLVGLLGWFGGRAINKALLTRHQQLKADLASAAEARAAAEARLKLHEARLASLEQEIAAMRAGIKEEAEAEKARLIAAAEDRARRIREETAFMLDQQVKEAEVQLKREAAEAAVKVAEQLLRGALDTQDQQKMVDSFVRQVASGDGTSAAPPPPVDGSGGPRPVPRSEV